MQQYTNISNKAIIKGVLILAIFIIAVSVLTSGFDPQKDYDGTVFHVNDNIVVIKPDNYNNNEVTFITDATLTDNEGKLISLTPRWYSNGDRVSVHYNKTSTGT